MYLYVRFSVDYISGALKRALSKIAPVMGHMYDWEGM